ncbi:MAG: DUF3108 domain-containing protein [Candidatus Eisenbacteria bacterium]|nr:DUF3108 domain-containing protein [Candidatus Eisenbacteria bacterium]
MPHDKVKKPRPAPAVSAPAVSALAAVLILLATFLSWTASTGGSEARAEAARAGPSAGVRTEPATRCSPPSPNRAFVEGEWFHFSIRYGAIRAGDALMQVESVDSVAGRRCFRLVSKAESNSFFSLFFKVRDRVDSFMDAEELVSRRFWKNTHEGKHRENYTIDFDYTTGKARYSNGAEFDFPACSQDILSAFYYVRTVDLEVGRSVEVPCHADKKNYPLEVKVHRRERVKTPAGEFDCLVVEPLLKSSGLFKQKGKLTIWLTDDEYRIPVLMKSKIVVGSVSAILTEMHVPNAGGKYARAQKS